MPSSLWPINGCSGSSGADTMARFWTEADASWSCTFSIRPISIAPPGCSISWGLTTCNPNSRATRALTMSSSAPVSRIKDSSLEPPMLTCAIGTRPSSSFSGNSATTRGVAALSAGTWATPIGAISRSKAAERVKLRRNLMFLIDCVKIRNFKQKCRHAVAIYNQCSGAPVSCLGRMLCIGRN